MTSMQCNRKLVIIGAGGLGVMTLDIILKQGNYTKRDIVFIDDGKDENEHVYDIPVIGGIAIINEMEFDRCDFIVAISNNQIRKKIVNNNKHLNYINAIHPDATISNLAKLGQGNIILPNVTIDPEVIINNHVIINKNTSVGHTVVMQDYSQAAPGCQLTGVIGECAFLGLGVTQLTGKSIGNNCVVGAGAVVINDLPKNTTAVGVPAKVIKINEN